MSFTGFSLAAKTSQPQQTGNLFGSSTTTSQPQQTSALFGTTAAAQPQQNGGLFGAPQPQQTSALFGTTAATQPQQNGAQFGAPQPQPGSGLFGALAQNQPQQQQQGGGLFGAPTQPSGAGLSGLNTTQQSQPQQSGLPFGGTLAQAQNQTTNPNQSSGLFGGLGTQSTQNKPSLSLFANTATQSSQPQPQTSLFSSLNNPSAPQPTSLFGTSTSAAPQTNSLFGTSTSAAPQTNSLFGPNRPATGLTLGQSVNQTLQPQTVVPGVRIDVSSLRNTTRFNELTEDLQRQIEALDTFIQQQISYHEQCFALMPSHSINLSYIPPDVDYVTQKLSTVELALDNDAQEIKSLKGIVEKDAEDAKRSFRAIDNLKLPPQFHHNGMWSSAPTMRQVVALSNDDDELRKSDLIPYFNDQAETMSKTLDTYKRNLAEIEAHLKTVEASTLQQTQRMMMARGRDGANGKEDQVRELAAVLREFEGGILGVAGKVGEAREEVQQLALGKSGILGGNGKMRVGERGRSYGRY